MIIFRRAEEFTAACEEKREDDALNMLHINSKLYHYVFDQGKIHVRLVLNFESLDVIELSNCKKNFNACISDNFRS